MFVATKNLIPISSGSVLLHIATITVTRKMNIKTHKHTSLDKGHISEYARVYKKVGEKDR